MTAVTFDTLKFVKTLEDAGVSAQQAEAIARAQQGALSEALETQLATRSDLSKLEYEIRLVKWMVGLSLALSVGMISLLVRLFFALPH